MTHVIQGSSLAAFNTLFKDTHPYLVRFAQSLVGDQDMAEDLVQECFIRLWERWEQIDTRISVKSYLTTSVRNACVDHLRKSKQQRRRDRELLWLIQASEESMLNKLSRREVAGEVMEAITTLPSRCQLVFRLCHWEEMKFREVAELMGTSIHTVRNHHAKAAKWLRVLCKNVW